jgi:hypothetical protein
MAFFFARGVPQEYDLNTRFEPVYPVREVTMYRDSIWLTALCFVLASPIAGAADEAMTIKIRKAQVGDKLQVQNSDSMETSTKLTINGKTEEKVEKISTIAAFVEEILGVDAETKTPNKAQRKYENAQQTVGDKTSAVPLLEHPVVIEKGKGGQYTFLQNGQALVGASEEFLKKEFNSKKGATKEDDMLPKKPVKVGDTWTIDIKQAAADLAGDGAKVDVAKSTATGKLLKVTDKNGQKHGSIQVDIVLAVTELKAEMAIPLKAGSKMTISVTLEGCLDGQETTGKSQLTMSGLFLVDLPGVDMTVQLKGTSVAQKLQIKK